jgi:NADH:ubiquinone oxidoreductase subunit 3 (subunit A)
LARNNEGAEGFPMGKITEAEPNTIMSEKEFLSEAQDFLKDEYTKRKQMGYIGPKVGVYGVNQGETQVEEWQGHNPSVNKVNEELEKQEVQNSQEDLQYASEKYLEWLEKKEKREAYLRQNVDGYDELLEKQKNDKESTLEQLEEFLDNKILEKENRAKEALEKKYVLGVDPYINEKPELDQSKVEDWKKLMYESGIQIVKSTQKQTYNEWLNEQTRKKLFGKEKKATEILKESRFVQVSIGEWEALKKTLEETKNRFSISQVENEELKKAKCALLVTDGQHLPTIFSSITEEVVKKVVEVNDGLKDHIQNLELQNSKLAMEYLKAIDNSKLSDKLAAYEADENKYLKNRMKMYIGFSLLGLVLLIYDIVKLFF